jgi:hypothetical protein
MKLSRLLTATFALAAASLAQSSPPQESRPSPFQPILNSFAIQATWPPTSTVKVPLEADNSASTDTFMQGRIEGGVEAGKKYQARCIGTNCEFTLFELTEGGGQSNFQSLGNTFFILIDVEGDATVNIRNLTKNHKRVLYFEAIGSDEKILASQCFVSLETINSSVGPQGVVTKMVPVIDTCEPLSAAEQISLKTAEQLQDSLWRTCNDRPMSRVKSSWDFERADAIADQYLEAKKSYFSQMVKIVTKKLHLISPSFDLAFR